MWGCWPMLESIAVLVWSYGVSADYHAEIGEGRAQSYGKMPHDYFNVGYNPRRTWADLTPQYFWPQDYGNFRRLRRDSASGQVDSENASNSDQQSDSKDDSSTSDTDTSSQAIVKLGMTPSEEMQKLYSEQFAKKRKQFPLKQYCAPANPCPLHDGKPVTVNGVPCEDTKNDPAWDTASVHKKRIIALMDAGACPCDVEHTKNCASYAKQTSSKKKPSPKKMKVTGMQQMMPFAGMFPPMYY